MKKHSPDSTVRLRRFKLETPHTSLNECSTRELKMSTDNEPVEEIDESASEEMLADAVAEAADAIAAQQEG